jgi:hypothetical protein
MEGKALWSYDYELLQRDASNDFAYHFGIPFHQHAGEIVLTDETLTISGDEKLSVPLSHITQIALGFDDNFPDTLVKNFGLFWQPLRIMLRTNESIYLIIDYNIILGPKNKFWFESLKKILSDLT